MLKQRVITALVLLLVLLGVLSHPSPWAFPLFMLLVVGAAGWEWARLSGVRGISAWLFAAAVAFACCVTLLHNDSLNSTRTWAWIATIWSGIWLLYACWLLHAGVPMWQRIPKFLRLVTGWLSLYMAWIAIVWLHARHGVAYLLSVMALVSMADVAAYFCGRAFGKRKLAPQISPGKSWAGAVGGAVGALVMAVLGARFLPAGMNNFYAQAAQHGGWLLLLLVAGIAVVSIMGDLVESLMKRSAGMKDSSNLLPGHGGVLDRIDSLLPVLPLACAAAMWMHG